MGNKGAGAILHAARHTRARNVAGTDKDNAWFLNRRIVTRNVDNALYPPTVVPFTYAALNVGAATQLNTLSPDPVQQQKIVSYLRGGSTFGNGPSPPLIEGVGIGQYRKRFGKLGNISDSKPVIVGRPVRLSSTSATPATAYIKARIRVDPCGLVARTTVWCTYSTARMTR
jgi:Tfp pilus tip-associated adhesin PilY1